MALTLANDLTGLVSREVDAAQRHTSALGESLATGNDQLVAVVDSFLGNSLRDNEIILGAIAKNTAYTNNMLQITDEYLSTISKALQEGLKTIGSAGPLSADKLAILQKNLNDKKTQVEFLIRTADFDGKKVLSGDATAINVQVGQSVSDNITISITNYSTGKLFRTTTDTSLNTVIAALTNATAPTSTTYYINKAQIDEAVKNNHNLVYNAITGSISGTGGSAANRATLTAVLALNGAASAAANVAAAAAIYAASLDAGTAAIGAHVNVTGAANVAAAVAAAEALAHAPLRMTANQFGALIHGLTTDQKTELNSMAPVTAAALTTANAGVTFVNATVDQLTDMFSVGGGHGAAVPLEAIGNTNAQQIHFSELASLLQDNVTTNISDTSGDETSRVIAQDVFLNALRTMRAEQANLTNQKSNVIEASDALRATTNVTQKAADSYLKTDYVLTAQKYAETIRTMVASITALQAANKVPEAAQRLIDSLAR